MPAALVSELPLVDEPPVEVVLVLVEVRVAELMVVLRCMTVPVAPALPPDATAPVPAATKCVVVAEAVTFDTLATSEDTVSLREAMAEERVGAKVMDDELEEEVELALVPAAPPPEREN